MLTVICLAANNFADAEKNIALSIQDPGKNSERTGAQGCAGPRVGGRRARAMRCTAMQRVEARGGVPPEDGQGAECDQKTDDENGNALEGQGEGRTPQEVGLEADDEGGTHQEVVSVSGHQQEAGGVGGHQQEASGSP